MCVCGIQGSLERSRHYSVFVPPTLTDSGEPKRWGVQRRKGIFTQVIIHDLKVAGGRAHAKGVGGL